MDLSVDLEERADFKRWTPIPPKIDFLNNFFSNENNHIQRYNEFTVTRLSIAKKFSHLTGKSFTGFYIYVAIFLFFKSTFFDDILTMFQFAKSC